MAYYTASTQERLCAIKKLVTEQSLCSGSYKAGLLCKFAHSVTQVTFTTIECATYTNIPTQPYMIYVYVNFHMTTVNYNDLINNLNTYI